MSLDYRISCGKPQACAGGLCGKERVKYTVQVFPGYPRALVCYLHPDILSDGQHQPGIICFVEIVFYTDNYLPPGRHSLYRVYYYIIKYLPDLVFISYTLQKVLLNIKAACYFCAAQGKLGIGNNHPGKVYRFFVRFPTL